MATLEDKGSSAQLNWRLVRNCSDMHLHCFVCLNAFYNTEPGTPHPGIRPPLRDVCPAVVRRGLISRVVVCQIDARL